VREELPSSGEGGLVFGPHGKRRGRELIATGKGVEQHQRRERVKDNVRPQGENQGERLARNTRVPLPLFKSRGVIYNNNRIMGSKAPLSWGGPWTLKGKRCLISSHLVCIILLGQGVKGERPLVAVILEREQGKFEGNCASRAQRQRGGQGGPYGELVVGGRQGKACMGILLYNRNTRTLHPRLESSGEKKYHSGGTKDEG